MRWSWKIGEAAGIGIFAHWTFLVLLGFVLAAHLMAGSSLGAAIDGVAFVLAIFACVALHELGHALAAQRYGIRTLDITLLPIGGLARLERIPDDPRQELWVALAGPAVNLAIALGLFLTIQVVREFAGAYELVAVGEGFLGKLMRTNIALIVFNLIPAFPMDGGRVLRALLARRIAYVRATRIAASAGQAMAVLFGAVGLFFSNWWILIVIAVFVYVAAGQEARAVQTHALLKDGNARTAMMTRFHVLSPANTLGAAANELLAGPQEDFPVLDQMRLVGVLPRNTLITALARTGPDTPVDTVMQRDCPVAQEGDTLEDTFEKMHSNGCSSLPVVRDGRVVGVVTLGNIEDWMLVQSAIDRSHPLGEVEELLNV
jgi:Zn-dependent protease/CBS domain-containing protein